MKAQSLIGSLPIYAQHLAELTGIKVFVEGTQAYTDGANVYVPFTEDDLPLSFGYIAHECSHVRNTDMGCFHATVPTPFRKNLLNVLEDIRIERLSMDQYPGTEDDIRYLNRKVLLEPYREELVAQCPPLAVVHYAILYGGYWLLQEPQLEVPAKAFLARMADLVGVDLKDQIMDLVRETLKCESTAEVLKIVDAIIALLPSQEDQQPDAEPEPDNGEGEGKPQEDPQGSDSDHGKGDQYGEKSDSSGTEGDGSKDTSAGGSESEGASEVGQGSPKQKSSPDGQADSGENSDQSDGNGQAAGSDASGQPDSQPGAPAQGQRKPSPQAGNLREQANSATENDLKGLITDVGDKAAELLGAKANTSGGLYPFTLDGRCNNRCEAASNRRLRLGIEQSSGLRQCLNGLLQAKVDCRVSLKRQGRRIDTGRLAMLKAGETRIFRSKSQAVRESASIQVLLDKSGSMNDSMDQAEAALYAVLKALDNLPLVTTGAMSFPTRKSTRLQRCSLIKSPKETLAAAVAAGGFGAQTEGFTPLAEALWPAAVEVLRAKGERKLLFVITDGKADSSAAAKAMVERCEASGIEVIALGFGNATDSVLSAVFSKYQAIGQVSMLKNALFVVVY